MKPIYKLLIVLAFILIVGNSMYLFTWTGDMLKGYWIGNFIGIIIGLLIGWLIK